MCRGRWASGTGATGRTEVVWAAPPETGVLRLDHLGQLVLVDGEHGPPLRQDPGLPPVANRVDEGSVPRVVAEVPDQVGVDGAQPAEPRFAGLGDRLAEFLLLIVRHEPGIMESDNLVHAEPGEAFYHEPAEEAVEPMD